jgi:hypothetical protein
MNFQAKNLFPVILGVLILVPPLAGCSDDDSDPADVQTSSLRVIHLSPTAPGVDVFANGADRVVENLMFSEGTGYLEVESGTYTFNISASGSSAAESVLDVEDLTLMDGGHYTAVAFGDVSSLMALALEDDHESLGEGDIRVRPIHTATAVGEVDIWNMPSDGDPSMLYEDVPYGVAGSYLDLPAGAYTLGFDADNDASPDLVFELPELSAGAVASVFAVSDAAGSVFLLAQLGDSSVVRIDPTEIDPGTASVRVIHMSPDAPVVDILVDGSTRAVSDLEFGQGTGYLELEAGDHGFAIVPAGGSAMDAVLSVDLTLEADASYTVLAYDELSGLKAMALVDDLESLGSGDIRVRAIHAASMVGEVDIWNIPATGDPTPLYEDVAFGAAGEYIDLPAAAYTLGFDVDNDASPDVVFELPELAAGTIANVYAVTDSAGALSLRPQLEDGTVVTIEPTL